MNTLLTKRNTVIIVALLTLWKVFLSATLQLHPDEAYYWLWSRRLDFGYFDHAPLIAYVIRLTTLFSQQELWVRFSGILEALIVSVLAWSLTRQLFRDERVAAASVVTLNTMPLTLAGSVIITPDIPVFLFVSLATYWYWQVVTTQKTVYWYLTGIAFGLGLLSKYTAVLFAPSLLLFVIATDERRWLKTIHPYAAFLVGCAFFLPVVYWNSKHEWISFAFQLHHGLGGAQYHPGKVLSYIGGQMLVAGPVLWAAGAYASVRYCKRQDKERFFLSLTFLATILFFAYSSLKRSAAANWPCAAYFTFAPLVSHYLLDGSKKKERLWVVGVLLSAVLSLAAGLHARFGFISFETISHDAAVADATQFFYGWKELAAELEIDPTVKIAFADSQQVAAEISYYSRERIFSYVDDRQFGAGQYQYWAVPLSLKDQNGVCVYLEGHEVPPCREYFTSVAKTDVLPYRRGDLLLRTYNIMRGSGYRYPAGENPGGATLRQ